MIVTTTETIPGKKVVQVLGIVKGNTIRARHLGKDILAGLKNMVGGEIEEYTKMMAESREQALDRMSEDGRRMEADAILNVRFSTSSMMQSAAELLAYGTAVKCEDDPDY